MKYHFKHKIWKKIKKEEEEEKKEEEEKTTTKKGGEGSRGGEGELEG
jgi:hypothetical protein